MKMHCIDMYKSVFQKGNSPNVKQNGGFLFD